MAYQEDLEDDNWTPAKPAKPTKSKWWWRDYDYDRNNYSYNSYSGSRSWRSKIGYTYGYGLTGSKKKEEGYQDLLNQLQNSANLIHTDGHQNIVKWSNGENTNDNTDPKNRIIYLSPDGVIEEGSSVATDEMIDALTGKVYLASALRETVHLQAKARAKAARVISAATKSKRKSRAVCLCGAAKEYGECCRPVIPRYGASNEILVDRLDSALVLWEAMETSIARQHVLNNWAGFSPYIYKDAERSSVTKAGLQTFINESAKSGSLELKTAVAIVAWNLLNTTDLVVVPPEYGPCIDVVIAAIQSEIPAEDRFDACYDIVVEISRIVQREQKKLPEFKPSPDTIPKLLDTSMFGGKVVNSVDTSLAEQKAEGKDKANPLCIPDANDSTWPLQLIDLKPIDSINRVEYNDCVRRCRATINTLRSRFMLRENQDKLQSYGYRSGDIDENNLHKIVLDDDRLMMRTEIKAAKKYAFGLLVDESGSMDCSGCTDTKIVLARNVAVTLAEALRGITGVELSIYGHTADDNHRGVVELREYISPRKRDFASLMQLDARAQNIDSYAIMHTANKMLADYLELDKYLFVISDGMPAGLGYGGSAAQQHMLQVCNAYRKKGVEIYGIGIANAFPESTGNSMYGAGRFVVLEDVMSSVGILSRFITQVLKK